MVYHGGVGADGDLKEVRVDERGHQWDQGFQGAGEAEDFAHLVFGHDFGQFGSHTDYGITVKGACNGIKIIRGSRLRLNLA